MSILIIDNYDSFTYNLVHYFESILDSRVDVLRNDDPALADVSKYEALVFSPGPGLPEHAGKMMELIREHAGNKVMLGICLGMQAMGMSFGAELKNLNRVVHGQSSWATILDPADPFFEGLPRQVQVGRYHSWVVDPNTVPEELQVSAVDSDGNIMAIRHRNLPIVGVQFHPESVLTPDGYWMIQNFVKSYL